ncbi:MAG: hypothetical protein QXL85_05185 [Candidatus Bathyarchaeia archaeon]
MTEEEKKLKMTIDFSSCFKFWLAFLVVQIIATIITVAIVIGLISLMMPILPRVFPASLTAFAQDIPKILP